MGSNGSILSVPTPEMYQGDFSKLVNNKNRLIPIYDPTDARRPARSGGFTRRRSPGNIIPQSHVQHDSADDASRSRRWSRRIGAGIVPGHVRLRPQQLPCRTAETAKVPTDKGSMKIDQNFGSNHHVAFFYNRTRNNQRARAQPALPACPSRSGTARSPVRRGRLTA